MSSAYQKVARTRPRIRRDVLFTRTEDGVLFHNATSGFRITAARGYRLASLLVPHLDGTKSVADLCSALPDRQRGMVADLVGALYDRDFARHVPIADPQAPAPISGQVAEQFAAQIGYLDHYADRAPQRFAAFRQGTVAVLGTGTVAVACVTGLVRNGLGNVHVAPGPPAAAAREEVAGPEAAGCPVTVTELTTSSPPTWAELPGVDVVLVAGGDRAAADAYALLHAGIPAGVQLLPAWVFGSRAIVGPVMGTGHPSCWCCAALRLTAVDPPSAAQLWSAMVVPGAVAAAHPLDRPLAAMIGNLLAYEVFRLLTGALPAETAGKVLVQNIETLDVLSEPLLPHPACPYCPQPVAGDLADLLATASNLDDVSVEVHRDPSEEADAFVAELHERSALIQPHVGVFTGYADEAWTQTPIKIGSVSYAAASGARRTIHAFDVHHVAGARRRALFAAAVSYTGQLASCPRASDQLPRIAPDRVLTATGGAEAHHERWVPVVSMLTGTAAAVPAAAVEPFGPANRLHCFEPTASGSGAAATVAGAVQQALSSALAYAAIHRALAGEAVGRVPLAAVADDPERTFLVKSAANLGIAVELLDLSPVALVPVLLAWCAGPDGAALWAVAADPSPRRAVTRALCDLVGRAQVSQQAGAESIAGEHDPVLTDFDPRSLPATAQARLPLDGSHTWAGVLESLRATGIDPYVTRVGGADLRAGGIEAVRVVLVTEGAGR